ncbi:MAG: hypothetical protein ACNFW9_04480 [Candidatus Kerfeldbacteria bacterium]|jgi:hypothetical protein
MVHKNAEQIQSDLENKLAKRRKKKKPSMKVSGRQVKNLQKIIISKGK